jgi:hypothetical protein
MNAALVRVRGGLTAASCEAPASGSSDATVASFEAGPAGAAVEPLDVELSGRLRRRLIATIPSYTRKSR